jgi:Family of unknown function (DUF6399)
MTPGQTTADASNRQGPFRWQRSQATDLLFRATHGGECPSLRAFARANGLPHATLSYWRRRRDRLPAPQALRDFFESPAGHDFLRGLVCAAHLSFQQAGACGIRALVAFFRLAGLHPFVACSFGAQQRLAAHLEGLIVSYGQGQKQRLAAGMARRDISLAEDENFHQGSPCLVAVEPCSNFLVVELCRPNRDAGSWTQVVSTALEGLPVRVVQVTSDQAGGIVAHAKDGLGAHHSPDLMHLQQDLHRATALPLQAQLKRAQEEEAEALVHGYRVHAAQEEQKARPRPGRPRDLGGAWEQAKADYHRAAQAVADCRQLQARVKEAVRGLGDDYHPFDAEGRALGEEGLRQKLSARLAVVEGVVLSQEGRKKVARAREMVPALVATLAWFWLQARGLATAGGWAGQQRQLLLGPVLAWAYWEQAARRGRDAAHRHELRERAWLCRQRAERGAAWQALAEPERARLLGSAREMAGRWQRSSSCVEGRNGQLSLRLHGRRGLTERGLAALTVLHNYFSRRADGTTAAERFFGQKPDDLFGWLLQRLPELPRPAQPRPRKAA